MTTVTLVRKSAYHDSVALLALARELRTRTRERGGGANKTLMAPGAARSPAGPQAQRDARRRLERDHGPESGSAARTEAKGAVQPTMPPCARTISSVAALKAAK